MLFFNFLWLFYLMVLINGYTISKRDANEDTTRDLVDSLREEEWGRELRPRRHRLLRSRDQPSLTTKQRDTHNITTTTSRFQNSPFWKLFHRHHNRDKRKHSRRLRFEMQTTPSFSGSFGEIEISRNDIRKREASTAFADFFKRPKDFFAKTKNNQMKYFNMSSLFPTSTSKVTNATSSENPTLTSPVANTKSTFQPISMDTKSSVNWKTTSKTTTTEWVGTAQLEVLLDNIKARALQILVDQNPTVSSLVTTSANAISFDSDPSLRHIEGTTPTTHSAILGPRDATISNLTIESTATTHKIMRRSTTEEIYTIAQNVEDCLQHEIKSVYKKLKNKVCHYTQSKLCPSTKPKSKGTECPTTPICSDPPKSKKNKLTTTVTTSKSDINTLPYSDTEITETITKKGHKKKKKNKAHSKLASHTESTFPTTSAIHKTSRLHTASSLSTTPKLHKKKTTGKRSHLRSKPPKIIETKLKDLDKQQHRVVKAPKFGKKKKHKSSSKSSMPSTTVSASSVDDVTLLGLLEQMLVKTNEDNVLRMLTTPYFFHPKANLDRLSKRNIETLSDLKLKEQVHDYGELLPVIDYYPFDNINTKDDVTTTSTSYFETQPIDFESISEKISYKDYVNGYKYYLKYQKEMDLDDEKFSPMVRYQAHRHHKVDDIGKFILRKLPQIRYARNIFEDIDIEDQDISTKSDESWFRKHFYLFLDSTPRKFQTSETVALKSGQTESSLNTNSQLSKPSDGLVFQIPDRHQLVRQEYHQTLEPVVNLDQLSRTLEHYKNAISTSSMSPLLSNLMDDIEQKSVEPAENGFIIKMIDILLGGKDGRMPKKRREKKINEDYQIEQRLKRNVQKTGKNKENNLIPTKQIKPASNPSKEHKDKFTKLGVVQMIAQPTTVVKIQDKNKKEHKFKNFISRFYFGKKKDKRNKKAKLKGYRKRRFVPFKKLKEMFLGAQQESQSMDLHKSVSDYDIMTSEIDTFKAVKFDRMPKIEEMRKEIANITDDLVISGMKYSTAKSVTQTAPMEMNEDIPMADTPTPDKYHTPETTDIIDINKINEIGSNINKDLNFDGKLKKMTMSQLENYLSDHLKSIKGSSPEPFLDISTRIKATNMFEKTILESLKNQKASNQKYKIEINPEPSTTSSTDTSSIDVQSITSPENELDVVRDEVDKLQSKLIIYDSIDRYEAPATPAKKPEKVVVTPVVNNSNVSIPEKLTRLMFGVDNDQKKMNQTVSNNLIKKKKVIRAALFRKRPKIEKVDVENTIEYPNIQDYDVKLMKNSIPFMPIRRDSSFVAKKKHRPKEKLSKYSVSPDHYRDLLLWHGDILSADSVTTNNFLLEDSLGLLRFTTPNAEKLADEVLDMKRFIQSLSITPTTEQFKSLEIDAQKDHFLVGKNEVVKLNSPTSGKMSSVYPTTEKIQTISFTPNDNEIVFLGKAQYLSISKGVDFELGTELASSEFSKTTENLRTTRTHKYVKRVNFNSNLHPLPNVMYTKSHRTLHTARVWKKHTDNLNVSKKLQSLVPTSKMNRAPIQSFTTPLPMNSRDFQQFLKQSNLDVSSVTAPIAGIDIATRSDRLPLPELPTLHNNLTINDSLKIMTNNNATLLPDIDFLTNALKNLKSNSKNLPQLDLEALRIANCTGLRRNVLVAEGTNHIGKREKKIKQRGILFSKKEKTSIPVTVLLEDKGKERSDVTEYDNRVSADLQSYEYPSPTEIPTQEITMLDMPKHNNLLYFFIAANKTTSSVMTSTMSPRRMMSSTRMTTPITMTPLTATTPASETPITMQLMRQQTADKLLKRLGLKPKSPKRVRISYHYDIVYENRPKKVKDHGIVNRENRLENRVHDSDSEEVATKDEGLDDMMTSHASNKYAEMEAKSSRRAKSHLSNNKFRLKKKSKRQANESSSTTKLSLSKRNLSPGTYTAQNVAAFEVYLDVTHSTPAAANFHEKNAIQVHIALPHPQQNVKRQLSPSQPIFSAKMSDPVNLEYQVPVMDEKVLTTEGDTYLSPGLYMLVDNYLHSGYITLKPVLSDLPTLKSRQVTVEGSLKNTTPKCVTTNNVNDLKKVTLNKDFIAAINKHLVLLYDNFTSLNSAKRNVKKSGINNEKTGNGVTKRTRRDVWPSMKEIFLGDRTCNCHFKANQTLCPACVATDAVVDELIFEFNNLASFMNDHCTEIQTFFWMNPSGGKKLSDSVHRLDRMLRDYYKRVKGKCQGKTCQALAGCHSAKRALNNRRRIMRNVGLLPEDVHTIANDLAHVFKHRIPYNERLMENSQYFLNVIDNCLPGVRREKSRLKQKRLVRSFQPTSFSKDEDKTKSKRQNYKKPNYLDNKPNYNHEELQFEESSPSAEEASWDDKDYNYGTENPDNEGRPMLTMDPTLNALTHNLNELFVLFNNMNETDSDPLTKLESQLHNDKKDKKAEKKKTKKKKSKFNLFRKNKHKEIKTTPRLTTDTPLDIGMLLSQQTQNTQSTRALRVIVSNDKEKPGLYVTVDTVPKTGAAATTPDIMPPIMKAQTMCPPQCPQSQCPYLSSPLQFPPLQCPSQCPNCRPQCPPKCQSQPQPFMDRLKITNRPTKVKPGECIIFEEGCDDKYNFLHRIQQLLGHILNNTKKNFDHNYSYNKARLARTPTLETGNGSEAYNTMILTTNPLREEGPAHSESNTQAGSETTTQTVPPSTTLTNSKSTPQAASETTPQAASKTTPQSVSESTTKAVSESRPAPSSFITSPTNANNKDPIYTSEKLLSEIDTMEKYQVNRPDTADSTENTEDVISIATPSAFPTIIIIDEGLIDPGTDEDLTIEMVTPENNGSTSYPDYEFRELLLSILSFEKKKLNEEWHKVRDSRRAKKDDCDAIKVNCSTSHSIKFSSKNHFFMTEKYDLLNELNKLKKKIGKTLGCACLTPDNDLPTPDSVRTKHIQPREAVKVNCTIHKNISFSSKDHICVTQKYDFLKDLNKLKKKIGKKLSCGCLAPESPDTDNTQLRVAQADSAADSLKGCSGPKKFSKHITVTKKYDVLKDLNKLKKKIGKTLGCGLTSDEPITKDSQLKLSTLKHTKTTKTPMRNTTTKDIAKIKSTKVKDAKVKDTIKTTSIKDTTTQDTTIKDDVEKIKEIAKIKAMAKVEDTTKIKDTTVNDVSKKKVQSFKDTVMTYKAMKNTEFRDDIKPKNPLDYKDTETGAHLSMEDPESQGYEIDDPDMQDDDYEGVTIKDREETTLFGTTRLRLKPSKKTTRRRIFSRTPKVTTEAPPLRQETTEAMNKPKNEQKKACDARRVSHVCDLSATIKHTMKLHNTMAPKDFEQHVKNLNCYKYKRTPRYFVIPKNKMSKKPTENNKMILNWNWIRSERASEDINHGKPKSFDKAPIDNVLVNFVVEEDFEKFYKGEHGIYRMENSKRRRRTVETMDLTKELTDLPPLLSAPNEILTMDGDPVVLHCTGFLARTNGGPDKNVKWVSEPEILLRRPNVKIEGATLHIDNVRKSNAGSYVCKEDDRIRRDVQLTVLALPTFQIVSTPMYSIQEGTCTNNDLRAIQLLSTAMSQLVCPEGHCSVDVHGPDCLRDKTDNSVLIRAIQSLTVAVPAVACGASCKRDLAAQLVRMAVQDVPELLTVDVFMEGVKNKTLVPIARDGPFAVTRKLRRRGISRHERCQHTSPGNVDVTLSCQRGYRLLPSLKICSADTPAANKTARHKAHKPSNQRPTRRYDWWWYPGCGYCLAAAAAGACAVCAACALGAQLASRPARDGPPESASRRPVSPSRVILARLFKRSLSAFRHTDSQETRSFPSKPAPPPLPPIDFD